MKTRPWRSAGKRQRRGIIGSLGQRPRNRSNLPSASPAGTGRFTPRSRWVKERTSGSSRPQFARQLPHHFHACRAAIIGRLLRRKFVADRNTSLPDFFQLRIIDSDRGEPIPIPLLAGAAGETFDGVRDLFACPFHRSKKNIPRVGIGQGGKRAVVAALCRRVSWRATIERRCYSRFR